MEKTWSELAYGKLNLALDIVGKRSDGYHLVRMIMQTVGIYDEITITQTREKGIHIQTEGNLVPADETNLAFRAAKAMCSLYGIQDGLNIHLTKQIPVGAGMGGGSADAAAVLRLLRRMYDLPVSNEELRKQSLSLGADVPYCIEGGTRLCEGIGEELTALPSFPSCTFLIVRPEYAVSTAWVYREYDHIPEKEIDHPDVDQMVKAIQNKDLSQICALLKNVLEQETGTAYPKIKEIEKFFLSHGAKGSIMTGSGSAVYGIYDDKEKADWAYASLLAEPAYQNCMKLKTEPVFPSSSD